MDGNRKEQNRLDRDPAGAGSGQVDAFEIFEDIFAAEEQAAPLQQEKTGAAGFPLCEDPFYEIEYDSGPFPGVGRYVLKSDKLEKPPRDPIRERFDRMRDIARQNRTLYFPGSKFYDKRVREENSRIFYKQGMFMEDFEDNFEKPVSYSAYYPGYQNMGYEQLRTYFTWRSRVRQGDMEGISLSYAFLYIYELLNNIGAEDPKDGLYRLMLFWDAYRVYDATIDKYLPGWLKDYYIYYGLEGSFADFAEENGLREFYSGLDDSDDIFELLSSISKYDVKKSIFYGDGNQETIRNCFVYTMQKLEKIFAHRGITLEAYIFQPARNMTEWTPFKSALFYPRLVQEDRRVVVSRKELYVCSGNKWTFNTVLTAESGKRLIGYVMKQMEAVLRKAMNYRHKLSANVSMLSPAVAEELKKLGICLEETVTQAVMEYYREANKTVVKIDYSSLEKIRRESLMTQEKLIVPEPDKEQPAAQRQESMEKEPEPCREQSAAQRQENTEKALESCKGREEQGNGDSGSGPWEKFGETLNGTERKALAFALFRQTGDFSFPVKTDRREEILFSQWENVKQFADSHGIMAEVLADGINEKAMDLIGDGLLDEEFVIYEDYVRQVKEMVEEIWQRRYLQG